MRLHYENGNVMNRLVPTLMAILLVAFPLFSQTLIVPDPAFLPSILDSTSYYMWDSEINDWVEESHSVYTYDANGNLSGYYYYNWDPGIKDWIISARGVNSYDANGNRTEYIDYEWDSSINDWVGTLFYVSGYDNNGKPTGIILYNWDIETHDWFLVEKSIAFWSELASPISAISAYNNCIFYPNPTNDLLTIETDYPDHYSIEITSLNGQQILIEEMDGT